MEAWTLREGAGATRDPLGADAAAAPAVDTGDVGRQPGWPPLLEARRCTRTGSREGRGGGHLWSVPAAPVDRAFAAGAPYLVNVLTDPADAYPRSSNLG